MSEQSTNAVPIVVGLGETLWDIFPDGPRLGGAPLNFACSAAELAPSRLRVCMVSAVGDDELGHRALDSLVGHGVDTTFMQKSDGSTGNGATGQVLIELDSAGVASYRFADDAAWDQLSYNDNLEQLAAECHAVCFGTLGQRSPLSRATIQKFVAATSAETLRILDVNMRPPFVDSDVIHQSLNLANVLKLNDDELPHLASECGVTGNDVEIMRQLAGQFQLRCVALTRGARGALLVCGNAVSDRCGSDVDVVDTVGAGDAFTAAMTLGLLAGRDIDDVNERAIATASYVCSQPGATMSFPERLIDG